MARNLPDHVRNLTPAPRVIHYVDPVPRRGEIILHTEAEVRAFRANQRRITERHRRRLAVIAERDRKVRRFWLGFGAVVGTVFLTVAAYGGWWVWQHLAALGLTAAVIVPVILLLAGGIAGVGHRCITIIQHWH